jgi:hypothetical protein
MELAMNLRPLLPLVIAASAFAADLPGSKDPPGMKRYQGSEIIGYRAPEFDEFLLPLGPRELKPAAYQKSLKAQGLVSRYIYLAPACRTPVELLRNSVELTSKFAIAADRLDSFGCGLYAPVASNESEEGRAKNRRVELVKW